MKLPDDKNFLLYIKTAKTAGTSFLDFLSQIKNPKIFKRVGNKRILENVVKNDIIVVFNDNLEFFKEKYPKIYNDSFKVLISRNPYDKIISCLNYHELSKNKNLTDLLKNNEYLEFNSTEVDFKLTKDKRFWNHYSFYTHFYVPQTFGVIANNKLNIDYVIKYENLENDIYNLFNMLDVNIINIKLKHLNKTIKKNKNDIDKESLSIINKMFENDFMFLDYEKKR